MLCSLTVPAIHGPKALAALRALGSGYRPVREESRPEGLVTIQYEADPCPPDPSANDLLRTLMLNRVAWMWQAQLPDGRRAHYAWSPGQAAPHPGPLPDCANP